MKSDTEGDLGREAELLFQACKTQGLFLPTHLCFHCLSTFPHESFQGVVLQVGVHGTLASGVPWRTTLLPV